MWRQIHSKTALWPGRQRTVTQLRAGTTKTWLASPQQLGGGKEAFRGSTVLTTPWFQTSSFQNYETIHFSCFKPASFCTLLRQPSPQHVNYPRLITSWVCLVGGCDSNVSSDWGQGLFGQHIEKSLAYNKMANAVEHVVSTMLHLKGHYMY